MRHSVCCSDERRSGTLSTQTAGEPICIIVSGSPDHDSVYEQTITASDADSETCLDTSQEALDHPTVYQEVSTPDRISSDGSRPGTPDGSLNRTPPNVWVPSTHAPWAPRKTRPAGLRPRRPTPYEERVARDERRGYGDVEQNIDDQPSALMAIFGDTQVRAMVGAPRLGMHSLMSDLEPETMGHEWTMSDDEDY